MCGFLLGGQAGGQRFGPGAVGGYLAISALITIVALWGMGRVAPEEKR